MWDADKKTDNVWLTIADLPKSLHASAIDSKEYVSDIAAKNMRIIPTGTLLVSFKLTLGRLAYAGTDLYSNEAIASLFDVDERKIQKRFLYWALSAFDWDKAAEGDQKIKGKTLNKAKLKRIPIPLPPPEEQRRIVAVLDEAFEGLERARAHAEANLENAQGFFLSALREVFRNDGKKWETSLPPDPVKAAANRASEEISRKGTQTGGRAATLRPIMGPYSLSVLDMSVLPRGGWKWTRLTDLARLESGHTPSRKHPEYWGGDVPWIGIKDARDHHGKIIETTLENTNELGISNSSARVLPPETVCLSRTASVGYVTVMGCAMATSQDFVNWVCGDGLSPEFLKFLLLAQGDEIKRFASGSVHQTIYYPEVKAFNICHPPIKVQREICTSLECIAQESAELADSFEAKLRDLIDLRQSILQRAFAGELT